MAHMITHFCSVALAMPVRVREANVEGCGANSASSDFCAKAEKGPAVLQVRRWLNLVQRCMTTAVQAPFPLGSPLAELGFLPLAALPEPFFFSSLDFLPPVEWTRLWVSSWHLQKKR